MRNRVIGQTGRVVLSDEMIQYRTSKRRTVRYQYTRMKCGWIAWVCGPFHSQMYGVCSYGTKRASAKAALQHRLACDYRHNGKMMFSDVDEADNVGEVNPRLSDKNAMARPITFADAVGSAGA